MRGPARERGGITPEPLVRLGALSPPGGAASRSPSYEERAGALIRRSAPPEGLAAGELEQVWTRLARARRSPAPARLGPWTWARWSVALAVLGVSGAAVAAVTGAWTWPRATWRHIEGSSSSIPGSVAGRPPRARPGASTARDLASSRPASVASAVPAAAPAEAPAPAAVEQGSSSPLPAQPGLLRPAAATRAPGALEGPSHASGGAPVSPPSIPPTSPPAIVTPSPFVPHSLPESLPGSPTSPVAARAAARPADLALAEEGELLGRAVARLRQARDPAGALADLDRYAARFPSGLLHREAQAARVDALLLARRTDEARRVLDQLPLGGDARDRELRLIRAELSAESAPARALEEFRAVWAAHPSGATGERSLWGMAACQARLGDEARTRAALELYLARFPDGPHAAAAAARAARPD
ncbi:MAG TPA: hypothetical protein VIU64_00890 [Polyangia bacterium]